MGRVLPVAYWATGDVAASGGGAALPAAHLSAVVHRHTHRYFPLYSMSRFPLDHYIVADAVA